MTKKILAGIGAVTVIAALFVLLTAATTPAAVGNLYKVTSRDGITVYKYDNCIIVKTNNSVSITR